jgi:alcohol dehydrogenase
VIFGPGKLDELRELVTGQALIVTSAGHTRRGLTQRVRGLVGGDPLVYDRVESNPTLDQLEAAAEQLRGGAVDTIIGLGGGSAMDSAKVLRLALARGADFDLRAAFLPDAAPDPLPTRLLTVPTTAGTGSEVTPTATVWDRATATKHSVGGRGLFADVAIVDPELTHGLPWLETLSTGLDAYSQCHEAIWNRNAVPATTELAERGIGLVPPALRALSRDLADGSARTAMAEAALLSGLAISHTRTGLAHSMSYPITAHRGVPHGLACGAVLPAVLAFTLGADDDRVRAVRDLFDYLDVRGAIGPLSGLGSLADQMITPGRADNSPRPVAPADVRDILAATEAWLAGSDT